MTITLITGATRGLGLEAARQLADAGHTVYLGARDPRRGREAARRVGAGVRALALDVTSEESVYAAAATLRAQAGHLDVLVNNAGIPGPARSAGATTADDLHTVYDVNVYGVVRTTHAFLPLLEASADPAPRIVNVSSGLGSITACAEPDLTARTVPVWVPALAYASSKAALNMVTAQYARACPRLRINAVDPGYTATDFNGRTGTRTVAEGAAIVVRMAEAGAQAPTGGFLGTEGDIPW
ncbi:SDR family NAD(P)-dependent oxidoreductase [Streptomyces boncukensis]|uniref:SDR family NAD(P)-dependent oxidoreductase n=1 Tax=Streptomyces boncukensis TaxID=2711219 RepID=A0A6G4WSI1_9ACTN|nr:SDR family NAD(P)-dependent oxidoreductase [Streptomyces boncukensis]NGO67587.1 SDR family NAD(P)-dependent oxidoreductase [Streptomyces boncukensis]